MQRAVLVDADDAGLGAQLQKLHRVPHQDPPAGLGPLLLGLGGAQLVLGLVQVPAKLRLPLVEARGIRPILKLLFHGFQFFAGKVCGSPGLFNDVLSFLPGRLHGLFLLLLKLGLILLALLLDFRRLLAEPFRLHTGGLHLLPLAFQLRQHILKVLIALIYQAVRFLEDFLGQSQLP